MTSLHYLSSKAEPSIQFFKGQKAVYPLYHEQWTFLNSHSLAVNLCALDWEEFQETLSVGIPAATLEERPS